MPNPTSDTDYDLTQEPPAFPTLLPKSGLRDATMFNGMRLVDWYAGLAMQALIEVHANTIRFAHSLHNTERADKELEALDTAIVEGAFAIATNMMKERMEY